MTLTANRRRKVLMPMDIKKKFAAAICMLLIAAIMMISSTYAWFTLSTAPEVTGITTNVGANGNLEIALLTPESFASNADDLGILTGVGDSMAIKSKTEANITWGNLVDLDDANYGLGQIVLNPSALNIVPKEAAGAAKLSGHYIPGLHNLLLAPTYGADGRVISVQQATTTGLYRNNKFEETSTVGGAGVRAIGVSSGITVRVSSYRAALSQITVQMAAAKAAAQRSLVDNGQNLASLLVTALADDSYALTEADVTAINAVKTDLLAANESIADAIRQAALAYYLSAANTATLSDAAVAEKVAAFADAPLNTLATLADGVDLSFLSTVMAAYNAAEEKIDGINVTAGQPYSEVTGQFDKLLDRDYTLINGEDGSTVSMDNIGTLLGAIVGAGKVEITMKNNSGIYADFAEMVGNYTASGLAITVTYNGIAVENMPTTMATAVTGTAMLTTAQTSAGAGDPTSDGGATSIDNTYGYVLDFGFRTNASDSKLLLQQDVRQRVYSDSEADNTNGGGTYIEFTTADPNVFSGNDMTALMSAIRVVFVTPSDSGNSYEILAVAAPNLKYTIDANGNGTLSAADGRFGNTVTTTSNASDVVVTVSTVLYLYDLDDIEVTEIVADHEYSIALGKIKTTGEGEDLKADFSITDLVQNKAKKISALVYIDGDLVDNTMVANAQTSMSGKLNLQFASSAELIPMENTALREGEGGSGSNAGQTLSKATLMTAVTAIKASNSYTTAAGKDAADRTDDEAALIAAVAGVEALADDATTVQLESAAVALGQACLKFDDLASYAATLAALGN